MLKEMIEAEEMEPPPLTLSTFEVKELPDNFCDCLAAVVGAGTPVESLN